MNDRDTRWWNVEKSAPIHDRVTRIVRALLDTDQRRKYYQQWRAIYSNDRSSTAKPADLRDRRHRFNAVAAVVDAAHSKQVSQRPRPQIMTTGGNTVQATKAKRLTDWVAGQFDRLDLYADVTEPAALESKIVGTAFAKVLPKNGAPCVELVRAESVLVDPREEAENCVNTLYHVRAVDRWVLAEEFPRHRGAILAAPASTLDMHNNSALLEFADLIMVVEAWRLPISDRTPGRHTICIETATLRSADYTKKHFPFVKLVWAPKPCSFFGKGMVEESAGTQLEIDDTTATISDAFNRCTPFVVVPTGTKFNRHQLDNEPWAYYTCDGDPRMIHVVMPPPIQAEVTMREDRLIARVFEQHRISQMSAEGKKPAGLNSGKALIVHNDVESMNHIVPNRAYERFCVKIGELVIECAKDCANEERKAEEKAKDAGKEYERGRKLVSYSGKDSLEAIDFRDVDLGDDPAVMRAYPVSALSAAPQARYEQLSDMAASGMVDIDEARDLLDHPDISGKNRRRFAARNLIDTMLDKAMADGKRSADLVNRFMDLQYAQRQSHLAYCEALLTDLPKSHVEAVEEICGAITTEIENMRAEEAEKQAAAAAQMAPPPAPMPPAQGGGPPPSMAPPLPMAG